jgi:hypothetical protein
LVACAQGGISGIDCFTSQGESIVAAWQAGAISRETMLDLFRRGEVLPTGRMGEEEVKLLTAPPMVSAVQSSGRRS